MDKRELKEVGLFTMIMVGVFATAMAVGLQIGSKPERCREVVLEDIRAHQKYEAQLQPLVTTDFLAAMNGGKK